MIPLASRDAHQGANACQGKKPHQGIFSKNHTLRIVEIRVKWLGTHQVSELWGQKVASGSALDANGNTLSKSNASGTTQYGWDFENRLTQAVVPSVGTTTFRYDPFGRRVQKSGPNGTTNYVYDGGNVIEEVDGAGNAVARYAQSWGIDEPVAEQRSGTTSFYQEDGLGSVTSLSTLTGTISNSYTYDTFGNATLSGSFVNPYRYTARDYDSETGLQYTRARYYDPSSGRFISEDPLGFTQGPNYYAYVANDPVNLIDPSGMRTRVCCRRLKGPQPVDVWSFLRMAGARGSGQKHCFILITGDEVPPFAPDGTPTNGRITIALNRNEQTGDGEVHGWNFGSDRVKNENKDCVDVPGATPCKEKNMWENYQDPTANPCAGCGQNYHWLGPNSNTFVFDTLTNFGMTPPPVKRAPGYKQY